MLETHSCHRCTCASPKHKGKTNTCAPAVVLLVEPAPQHCCTSTEYCYAAGSAEVLPAAPQALQQRCRNLMSVASAFERRCLVPCVAAGPGCSCPPAADAWIFQWQEGVLQAPPSTNHHKPLLQPITITSHPRESIRESCCSIHLQISKPFFHLQCSAVPGRVAPCPTCSRAWSCIRQACIQARTVLLLADVALAGARA